MRNASKLDLPNSLSKIDSCPLCKTKRHWINHLAVGLIFGLFLTVCLDRADGQDSSKFKLHQPRLVTSAPETSQPFKYIKVADDGKYLFGYFDKSPVVRWSPGQKKYAKVSDDILKKNMIAVRSDGRLLLQNLASKVQIVDLINGKLLVPGTSKVKNGFRFAGFVDDKSIAMGCDDQSNIYQWNMREDNYKKVSTIKSNAEIQDPVASFAGDQSQLYLAEPTGKLTIVDIKTGQGVTHSVVKEMKSGQVGVSANAEIAIFGSKNLLHIYRPKTRRAMAVQATEEWAFGRLELSGNGKVAIVSTLKIPEAKFQIRVLDLSGENPQFVGAIKMDNAKSAFSLSSDGTHVGVVDARNRVKLWKIASNK